VIVSKAGGLGVHRGEMVLELGVAELVNRAGLPEHVPAGRVRQQSQEPHPRSPPAGERQFAPHQQGSLPGERGGEPGREPGPESGRDRQPGQVPGRDIERGSGGEPDLETAHKTGDEPGQQSGDQAGTPVGAVGAGRRRRWPVSDRYCPRAQRPVHGRCDETSG
jgi:hypothetical protein